ncbi:MAG: hypothetical protein GC184_13675 [Rhizobiales bacterium]|nr:hypothetical protein [Hyphomicrobiales bacterium]
MNRPGFLTWLIGNPLSLIGMWLLTAFLAYAWYAWQAPVLFPIVAAVVALSSLNANEHLGEYRQWKREWQAVGGEGGASVINALFRSRVVRFVVGGIIWCAFAYAAITAGNQQGMQAVAGLFWLGTMGLIARRIYRFARRNRAKPKPQEIRDVPVTQCLPVSQQSPGLAQALAALPDYCPMVV